MSVDFEAREVLHIPAADLLAAVMDPRSQEKAARHFGATTARCDASQAQAGHVRLELYTEQPGRREGGIDRATLIFDWITADRRCSWQRIDHRRGEHVQAAGSASIEELGEYECAFSQKGSIEIDYPFIGNQIAKIVARDLEHEFISRARYWEKLLYTPKRRRRS